MAIHFKFRSAVRYDSIAVEGDGLSVFSLKNKIVDCKSLGKGPDFDLLITNAETGEEYAEANSLVPKNTSVIIKRVPARRAKATVLVPDQSFGKEQSSNASEQAEGITQYLNTTAVPELYDRDDFGVDLYAVDDSALTQVDGFVNASNIRAASMEVADKDGKRLNATHHKRSSLGRSLVDGHSHAIPPPGYICHRCGQPEHFIQHCPTNGDPAFDVKKVFRSRDAEWFDPMSHSQLFDKNTFTKEVEPLPLELQCPLCQGIFKEAVMVSCCHYSFCHKCIRRYLLERKKCAQCGSENVKIDALLPNIALRQAIDRFIISQIHSAAREESSSRPVLGLESPTKVKAASPPWTSSIYMTNIAAKNDVNLPVVADSVCESVVGSKDQSAVEGNKAMPQAADPQVASRKRKKHISTFLAEDGQGSGVNTGKPRKLCYVCGSPDHLACHCNINTGNAPVPFPPQQVMGFFRPVGAIPPAAYSHNLYWHGQPIVPCRPLRMGYGESMCPAVQFDVAVVSMGQYGLGAFLPPIYPTPVQGGFHSGMNPGIVLPRDRPLSCEEFRDLQEREHRRRHNQEWHLIEEDNEREHFGAKLYSVDGDQSLSSELELSERLSADLPQKCGLGYQSVARLSDEEIDHGRKSKNKNRSKHLGKYGPNRLVLHHHTMGTSDDDAQPCRSHEQKLQQSAKGKKVARKLSKHNRWHHVERECSEEDVVNHIFSSKMKVSKESSWKTGSAKLDMCSAIDEQCPNSAYEGDRLLHLGSSNGELSYTRCHHRVKMNFPENLKRVIPANEGANLNHSESYDGEDVRGHYHQQRHQNQASENYRSTSECSSKTEHKSCKKHKKLKLESLKNENKYAEVDSIEESSSKKRRKSKRLHRHKRSHVHLTEQRWQMAEGFFDEECSSPEGQWFKHRRRPSHDVSD